MKYLELDGLVIENARDRVIAIENNELIKGEYKENARYNAELVLASYFNNGITKKEALDMLFDDAWLMGLPRE